MAKRQSKRASPADPVESRTAEAVTVAWMLTVLTTLLCELGTLVTRWYAWANPEAEQIQILSGLLLFAAVIAGVIALAILPVVFKTRRVPPPTSITIFAVIVSAAPLLTALLLAFQPT